MNFEPKYFKKNKNKYLIYKLLDINAKRNIGYTCLIKLIEF